MTCSYRDAAGNAAVQVTRTISVVVSPAPNTAPTITISSIPLARVDNLYSLLPELFDADGDTLMVTAVNLPTWLALNSASGELIGTPQAGDEGLYTDILLTVSDGETSQSYGPFDIEVSANTVAITQPSSGGGSLNLPMLLMMLLFGVIFRGRVARY